MEIDLPKWKKSFDSNVSDYPSESSKGFSVKNPMTAKDEEFARPSQDTRPESSAEDSKKESKDALWDKWIHRFSGPFDDKVDLLDLPRWMSLSLLGVYFSLSLGLFIYFVYTGTISSTKVKFISLASNSSDQICQFVPKTITGAWQADEAGLWSSNRNFNYNSSGTCWGSLLHLCHIRLFALPLVCAHVHMCMCPQPITVQISSVISVCRVSCINGHC